MDVTLHKKRQERHLESLKKFKDQVENMSFCHIVTHPLSHEEIDGKFCFEKTEDGWVHGIDAPGDWNEGFKEIKEGLLKYVNTHIAWAEEEIEKYKDT
jgi:hypothetical protein